MDELIFLTTGLAVLFLIFVAPIWLILHYATRNSASKKLSARDEGLMDELHEHARGLEDRIHSLERILDADTPEWRQ